MIEYVCRPGKDEQSTKNLGHPVVHMAKQLEEWISIKNCRVFPKIVSILALRVTSIFIGFTNRFFTVHQRALSQSYVRK